MTESTTRHRAVLIGLLVCLPVALLGGAAGGLRLADQHLATGGAAWSSAQTHGPRVARGTSVEISGTTRRLLRPGVSSRINLGFNNMGSKAVTLRHVRVTITGITAPQADAEHPCTRADFRVRPMRARTFVLPRPRFTEPRSPGRPVLAVAAPQDAQPAGEPGRLQGAPALHARLPRIPSRGQGEGRLEARRARSDPARPAGPPRPPPGRFGDGVLGRVGRRIGLRRHRHHAGGDAEPGHPDGRTLSRGAGVGGPDGHQPEPLQRPGRLPRARHRPGHRRVRRRRRALGMCPGRPSRSRPRPTRGAGWTVAGSGILSVTLTNALSMTAAAANACQGASLHRLPGGRPVKRPI